MTSYLELTDTMPLVEALWWFIENVNEEDPARSELFFHLRARYRDEAQS